MIFPLRYAHGNVLIGHGGHAAGLYRLGTTSYPYLPTGEKWALQRRLQRLAHTIGADFSLWRVNRAYPAEEYVAHTASLLDERHQEPRTWESFLEGHEARLRELGSHIPEVYLAVSLAKSAPHGFGSGLVRNVDRLRRRVQELAGIGLASPISGDYLSGLTVREQRVYERLNSVLALRRARTIELQWLLRRAASRGIAEPDLDIHWQPDALIVKRSSGSGVVFEPLGHDLYQCVNAPITERPQSLVIDSEQGRSYQAMLALGSLADAPEFPGATAEALFAPLEALGFPVDAVLHAQWLGNRQALVQVRKRIADVEHAYQEQLQGAAHGPGLLAGEDRVLAREYEAQLQAGGHPPMLYAQISLALGARSEQELERRVDLLKEQYGDIQVHRPVGLQRRMFFEHLPRADGWCGMRDYTQQLTVEQFGGMVATATRTVGSARGPYLGYTPTGARLPVRFDPAQAPREDRASGVLLIGTLGSGKTVASQAISYAAQRRGSLIVDFDPKPDHGWQNLPDLTGQLQVVELSGDPSQQGRLDPLAIGLEDMREELACSYLLELLPGASGRWENAVSLAVKDAVREGSHSLLRVVELLHDSERAGAREAGEALEVIRDFGLARLGFGDGSAADSTTQAAVTTIRMPGLSLPEPSAARDAYTRAERVSVATLSLVAAYALRLISNDRSRHKVVGLDEIWFLLASPQGRQIINRLVRLGRAFNATLLLGTHRIGDLGHLADLIGVVFVFGQDSDDAARAALSFIGLDATRELVGLIREFRAGRCLMRDLHGRVGEVQIDLVHPHLLAAFQTTPGKPARTGQTASPGQPASTGGSQGAHP